MELTLKGIKDSKAWESANIKLPKYDIGLMRQKSAENPTWLHFGAGNIFRGYIANLADALLERGEADTGIVAADTFDYDIIRDIYDRFDNLALCVGLKADGNNQMNVIASVSEAVAADTSDEKSFDRLKKIAATPSLQMISFTITEKGYAICDMQQEFISIVKEDMENGPKTPKHAMSIVTALLYERFKTCKAPIALVSMDNCSHNGEKLRNAIVSIANGWYKKGYVEEAFLTYIRDEKQVSFPWSMIDKITPRPDKRMKEQLASLGVENMDPVTTGKNTFIAPFVNAEIPQYLVIEDSFPNGRPALDKVGVYLTDRETVNQSEKMKVTTCLNPLHTALAVFGCLLGFQKISDEMQDEDLRKLVEYLGYKEGIPVVADPKIINPMDFIREVLRERLPNPYLPDTPQRIATDTSQKLAIRYGETIKAYEAMGQQDKLKYIPLVIAAWLRYLIGIDDNGNAMELSPDPMLEQLQNLLKGINPGDKLKDTSNIEWILGNRVLFGTDLCSNGMSQTIIFLFERMLSGRGMVRKILHEHVSE
ncbi:MAG: mannitol dehydrogenase family protein [Lachnospiraceae bacterium]